MVREASRAAAIAVSPFVPEVGNSCVIDKRDSVEFDVILGSLLHHEVVETLESHFPGDIVVLVLGKEPGVKVAVGIPGVSRKGRIFTLPAIGIGRETEVAQHVGFIFL